MVGLVYSEPYEAFSDVAARLNLVARLVSAQEWVEDGSYSDAVGLLADLEAELHKAIEQNEARTLRRAA